MHFSCRSTDVLVFRILQESDVWTWPDRLLLQRRYMSLNARQSLKLEWSAKYNECSHMCFQSFDSALARSAQWVDHQPVCYWALFTLRNWQATPFSKSGMVTNSTNSEWPPEGESVSSGVRVSGTTDCFLCPEEQGGESHHWCSSREKNASCAWVWVLLQVSEQPLHPPAAMVSISAQAVSQGPRDCWNK